MLHSRWFFGFVALALTAAVLTLGPGLAHAEKKSIKVGFLYPSPVGDAGWAHAHDLGRLAVEELDFATTSFVESVQEGPDGERVILNMARKGFDLILATSYGYMDSMLKVAGQFPDTAFEHCSGFKTAENMGNYFGRMYQARYLTGMVAGTMTTSNVIGYVAVFPIPEIIRGINAFALGVKKVNPEAKVHVVWTKTWYDPPLEKDAAKSLLDMGADVIAQHQNSPAAQEAAQQAGAYSIGYNTDMSRFAPKAHLTSAVWNWAPLYVRFATQVAEGTWKAESLWPGIAEGIVDIAPFGPMVPQEVQDMVNAEAALLKGGTDTVFQGPINNQAGEVVVAEGTIPSDQDLLDMAWFVDNVVGTTE
jgi:basic membrane protein A and related proteins